MARKQMTPDEEAALATAAEQSRDDANAWDYAGARPVARGGSPSAVLSVRVPLAQLRDLRRLAKAERMSLSELLKDALASYVAFAGPQVSSSGPRQLQFTLKRASRSETLHPGARGAHETIVALPPSATETAIAS